MELKPGLGGFKPYRQEMNWAYSTAPGTRTWLTLSINTTVFYKMRCPFSFQTKPRASKHYIVRDPVTII